MIANGACRAGARSGKAEHAATRSCAGTHSGFFRWSHFLRRTGIHPRSWSRTGFSGKCAGVALALLVGLFTVASAQQSPPAKQGKPATSESPPAKKGNPTTSESPPAKKGNAAKSAAVPPAPGGGQPSLLGQFGDWGAYAANSGGKQICYALAKPTAQATQPPNRPRDPAYIFVSTRPSENVRNEVSIVIGYPFKPGADASVDIGSAKYAMYTQNDGAWIKNAAEEARMVDTMRRGADLVVTGESGKGTKSTDRYNLRGLAQALDRVAQECK